MPLGIGPPNHHRARHRALIFGPKRLPDLGRSLGSGMREFKDSITGCNKDDDDEPPKIAAPAADEPHDVAAARRRGEPHARLSRAPRRPTAWHGTRAAADRSRGSPDPRRPPRRAAQAADRSRSSTLVAAFAFCFWQNNAILDIVTKPVRDDAEPRQTPSTAEQGPARAGRALSAGAGRRRCARSRPALAADRPGRCDALGSDDNLSAAQRRQIDQLASPRWRKPVGRSPRPPRRVPRRHAAQPRDARRHRAVHRDDHGRLLRGAAARDADAALPDVRVRPAGLQPARAQGRAAADADGAGAVHRRRRCSATSSS